MRDAGVRICENHDAAAPEQSIRAAERTGELFPPLGIDRIRAKPKLLGKLFDAFDRDF